MQPSRLQIEDKPRSTSRYRRRPFAARGCIRPTRKPSASPSRSTPRRRSGWTRPESRAGLARRMGGVDDGADRLHRALGLPAARAVSARHGGHGRGAGARGAGYVIALGYDHEEALALASCCADLLLERIRGLQTSTG